MSATTGGSVRLVDDPSDAAVEVVPHPLRMRWWVLIHGAAVSTYSSRLEAHRHGREAAAGRDGTLHVSDGGPPTPPSHVKQPAD